RAANSSTPRGRKRRPKTWATRRRRRRSSTKAVSGCRARSARRASTSLKRTRSTRSVATKSLPKRRPMSPQPRRKRASDGNRKGRGEAPPRGDRRGGDGLQARVGRVEGRLRECQGADQAARPREGADKVRP